MDTCDNCSKPDPNNVLVLGHNYDETGAVKDHMMFCQKCASTYQVRMEYQVCYCFENHK